MIKFKPFWKQIQSLKKNKKLQLEKITRNPKIHSWINQFIKNDEWLAQLL